MNYKFNENLRWPEERIRQELQRLDKFTGLNGNALPIKFTYSSRTLGSFNSRDKKQWFEFSRAYMEDPGTPDQVSVDTIRHEYAHYMDWTVYGNLGHGPTWKKCCDEINTLSVRLYNPAIAQHYRKLHERSEANTRLCAGYTEGQAVIHEKYGTGVIRSVRDVKEDRMLEIAFENGQTKILSARWLHDHSKT